jgi:hypothetical protein
MANIVPLSAQRGMEKAARNTRQNGGYNNMDANDFTTLDAQTAESSFAQFTPEEHAEYQAYLDWLDYKEQTSGIVVCDNTMI